MRARNGGGVAFASDEWLASGRRASMTNRLFIFCPPTRGAMVDVAWLGVGWLIAMGTELTVYFVFFVRFFVVEFSLQVFSVHWFVVSGTNSAICNLPADHFCFGLLLCSRVHCCAVPPC